MKAVSDAVLLVVDDNDDNRYTLTRRLERQGYSSIDSAENGRIALEMLAARDYDLVLLDVMMPEVNGYDVLERMKADPRLRDVPVIMISAIDQLDSVVRCIELGAEDYLAKPFEPTLLRARVGATLDKKRLRDAVQASRDRLAQELDAARTLQLGMLPSSFPQWSAERPVELHAYIEPAREVGGDLYDFFFTSRGVLCFLVADVCGKGAPAAMFMARTRSLVRLAIELHERLAPEAASPQAILETVNRELCQNNAQYMFVTLFLGFLDTRGGKLAFVNAGHPPPYLLRARGGIERVKEAAQLPLGIFADTAYLGAERTLEPGDALFACSDGVPEAMNDTETFYTDERLEEDLRGVRDAVPADIIRTIREHVSAFSGAAPAADDVTMLALRWLPAP